MRMLTWASIVIAACTLGAIIPTAPAAEKSATTQPVDPLLAPLAPYVGGEWRLKAAWADGTPLQAREIYDWGVGRKFITCKTWVGKADEEYQRYDETFGVQDGKLMSWSFAFDGHVNVGEFKVDGKTLSSSRVLSGDAGTLHQSVELLDANRFRWVVKIVKDGKDQPLIDGTWVREATAER
jgi:hypothetical protein